MCIYLLHFLHAVVVSSAGFTYIFSVFNTLIMYARSIHIKNLKKKKTYRNSRRPRFAQTYNIHFRAVQAGRNNNALKTYICPLERTLFFDFEIFRYKLDGRFLRIYNERMMNWTVKIFPEARLTSVAQSGLEFMTRMFEHSSFLIRHITYIVRF